MNVSFWCSWWPCVTFQGLEINGTSPNVLISTSVSRRAQSRPPPPPSQYVSNGSWISSCFLSRTCCSREKHRSCSQLMDLECGMFQESKQALITEVTVWTSRRITVIVLLESKEKGRACRINHSLSSLSDDSIVRIAIKKNSPLGPWVVCAALTQLWVHLFTTL